MNNSFIQSWRWYGPSDPVPLSSARQAGASGIVSALHHIPVGEVWSVAEIQHHQAIIAKAGLLWNVVESLPVSEDIKSRQGDYMLHIENYKQSIQNLAHCGISTITYNFMPVLDWARTDVAYQLADGSKALRFDRIEFVAFDVHILKRPQAAADYSEAELMAAKKRFDAMSDANIERVSNSLLMALPGEKDAFSKERIFALLDRYSGIDEAQLRSNLIDFLRQVTPVADACGARLAIHPDDPPYKLLGLPRVMRMAADIRAIIEAVPNPSNGLCFCTGSFSIRPDNDLPAMIKEFGSRINFVHLRSTERDSDGNFYEANHLEGSIDMFAIVRALVELNKQLPIRPDHGHQMLDDLEKQTYPGYSAIGRLRGLAEIRGLELGIRRMING